MNENNRGKMNYLREYNRYLSLIFQMFVIVAAGVLGGIELDRILNINGKVFTIILTILTSFLAIYLLFRTLLKK
jgi:hypothetical protein